MSKTVLIILSTVLVLGLTLLVTNILSRRKKTDLADWEVGGRDLPYYVVIGTQFATAMGGGVLVGHVGNAYNFGLSILFYGVFSSSTLLFIALIAKWLRRNNFVTVPDVVQSFRGRNKAISIFAGVMSAVIPFGWCISNLSAFAKLYTRMTGIPMNVLITCLAIACIAFVLPAGLKTVAWTDFIFGIVIVIGGVFVTMKSLDMAGGFSNVVEVLPPEIMSFPKGLFAVGGFTLLSWFLSLVPGGITNQMYFQRVFAIRDEKRIVPTLLISVVLVFLTDVWAFFMGTSIRAQNPDLAGEMATGWLLDQLPIWFIVIFAGMITCTILSTSLDHQLRHPEHGRQHHSRLLRRAQSRGGQGRRQDDESLPYADGHSDCLCRNQCHVHPQRAQHARLYLLLFRSLYADAGLRRLYLPQEGFLHQSGHPCLHGRRHRRVHHLPDHRHAHSVRCLRSGRLDHLLLRCRLSHPHSGQGRLIPSGNSF